MSGIKSNIANTTLPAGPVSKPVANAGQGEPSIDDILASIRQIISDQNRQADVAAEKAAAEVANKAPIAAKVESIIGTVAADHWKSDANEIAHSDDSAQIQEFVPPSAGSTTRSSRNLNKLEELIQLIGSTPSAPQPTQRALRVDPNSNNSKQVPFTAVPADIVVPVSVKNETADTRATKPAVILPISDANPSLPAVAKQETKSVPRLHPSLSPKSIVPPIIKDAIARPLANVDISNSQPSALQVPVVSRSSALDRLIARKAGVDTSPDPIAEVPVKQIVEPSISASVPAQLDTSQTAPIAPSQLSNIAGENAAAATQQAVANSPAISSQSVNAAVVNSIEQLATSMFEDRKDEIDGMMADVVRPMLQNWLEDNLPSLVERIVREEIERVSRGTHR